MHTKFLVLLFLMLLVPFSVQAHTTLLSSAPAEGENVTEDLKEVQLVFGTKIEEGSTMSIEGQDSSFEFDNIAIRDDSMVGNLEEKMPDGSYRILWNIIGEDGHPIEGEIAFVVSIKAAEKKELTAPAVTEKAEEPEVKSISASEKTAETLSENNSNLPVTILLVLVTVIVVYGIYKLLLKKK